MKKFNATKIVRNYLFRRYSAYPDFLGKSLTRLLRKAYRRGREDVANELCERVGKAQQEDEEMLALHRRGL